jgi:hypothetical protein
VPQLVANVGQKPGSPIPQQSNAGSASMPTPNSPWEDA